MTPLEAFLTVAVVAFAGLGIWAMLTVKHALAALYARLALLEAVNVSAVEDMALIHRLSVEMAEHFQLHIAQTLARVPNREEEKL